MRKPLMIVLVLLLIPCATWGQVILAPPTGNPPTNNPPPSNSPVQPVLQGLVVDAFGRPVGSTLTPYPGPAMVLVSLNGRVVSLQVLKSGIAATANLYFMTSDCTGTAYMAPDLIDALVQQSVIGLPGKTLYVPKAGAATQFISPVTQLLAPPVGTPACLPIPPPPPGVTAPGPIPLIAADKTVDLNQFFLPPFSIRGQ